MKNYIYLENKYYEVGGTLQDKKGNKLIITEIQLSGFIVINAHNSYEYISFQFLGNYEFIRRV